MSLKSTGHTTNAIHFGWIPYWNLLPHKCELQKSMGLSASFHNGHPSQVNRWLLDGVVDVAPCSSVCLVKSCHLELAAPYGIASDGAVQSVYLGFRRGHEAFFDLIQAQQILLREVIQHHWVPGGDPRAGASKIWQTAATMVGARGAKSPYLTPVSLTPNSAASVALTKILLTCWFGKESADQMLEINSAHHGSKIASASYSSPSVELLIGDDALLRRAEFWKVLDLGQLWKDLTGLPFVFAAWQSLRPIENSKKRLITESADLAQAKMRVDPTGYLPDIADQSADAASIDLPNYWKCIQYRLGTQHMQALILFLCLVRLQCSTQEDEASTVKILRWQDSLGHQ